MGKRFLIAIVLGITGCVVAALLYSRNRVDCRTDVSVQSTVSGVTGLVTGDGQEVLIVGGANSLHEFVVDQKVATRIGRSLPLNEFIALIDASDAEVIVIAGKRFHTFQADRKGFSKTGSFELTDHGSIFAESGAYEKHQGLVAASNGVDTVIVRRDGKHVISLADEAMPEFFDEGRLLATASRSSIKVRDSATMKVLEVRPLKGPPQKVAGALHGKRVIFDTADGSIGTFAALSGDEAKFVKPIPADLRISALRARMESPEILMGCNDGSVRTVDLASGTVINRARCSLFRVTCLKELSMQGRPHVVIGHHDGAACIKDRDEIWPIAKR